MSPTSHASSILRLHVAVLRVASRIILITFTSVYFPITYACGLENGHGIGVCAASSLGQVPALSSGQGGAVNQRIIDSAVDIASVEVDNDQVEPHKLKRMRLNGEKQLDIRTFTLNFGHQHPVAHGVLKNVRDRRNCRNKFLGHVWIQLKLPPIALFKTFRSAS